MKYIISIITIFCFTFFQPIKTKLPLPPSKITPSPIESASTHIARNTAPNNTQEKQVTSSQMTQQSKTSKTNSSHGPTIKKDSPIISESTYLSSSQTTLLRTTLLSLINQQRQSPVSLYNPLLTSTSLRAKEAYQKWSHTRPNQSRWNTTLYNIIDVNKVLHGENLAKIQVDYQQTYSIDEILSICQTLHNGLVNSPTHYKVMTNNNYKKVNIGVYTQVNNNILTIVIAQHFIQ